MRTRIVLVVILVAGASEATSAQVGKEVLDSARADARRQAESSLQNAVNQHFPYNGSLYGLPGQTRSDSVRESALRAALGSITGSCKPVGAIDLTKLPTNLQMNVSGILSNTTIQVPPTALPAPAATLNDAASLIPKATQVANGQVKVGGDWMPLADYQRMQADTQNALQSVLKSNGGAGSSAPSMPSAPAAAVAPVSRIWAPPPKN